MKGASNRGMGKVFFLVLIGVVMGLVLAAQTDVTERLGAIFGSEEEEAAKEQAPAAQVSSDPGGTEHICLPDFTFLAEKLDPAVVNISTTQVVKGGGGMGRGFGGRPHGPGGPGFGQQPDPFEEFFDRFFRG